MIDKILGTLLFVGLGSLIIRLLYVIARKTRAEVKDFLKEKKDELGLKRRQREEKKQKKIR